MVNKNIQLLQVLTKFWTTKKIKTIIELRQQIKTCDGLHIVNVLYVHVCVRYCMCCYTYIYAHLEQVFFSLFQYAFPG